MQQVCQEAASDAIHASPSHTAKASTQEILQILCEQSVSVAGRKAVAVAVSAVPGALRRLMALMHVGYIPVTLHKSTCVYYVFYALHVLVLCNGLR